MQSCKHCRVSPFKFGLVSTISHHTWCPNKVKEEPYPITRPCKWCGDEFESKERYDYYCSKECADSYWF